MINIGLEIGRYLKEIGMTQIFLSRKTKIAPAKLSFALSGKRKLTLEEYAEICWALGVNIDKFLKPMNPTERSTDENRIKKAKT